MNLLAQPTGPHASTKLADADQRLRQATRLLADAGIKSPAPDAKALFAWAWDISVSELGRHVLRGSQVPAVVDKRLSGALKQRAERTPLQHITGTAPFRYLELEVGPGVFIPRPETELLVSQAIEHLDRMRTHTDQQFTVIDLCTGSGAIAIALATEVPGIDVHAVELSPVAAEYTARNIDRYRAQANAQGSNLTLHVGDATEFRTTASAQVITCNPPYVARNVDHSAEVQRDPDVALFGGGDDGAELPVRIIHHVPELLAPGGMFVCEHAEYNAAHIARAFSQAGLTGVSTVGDYTGRDRFTRGYAMGEDDSVSHI